VLLDVFREKAERCDRATVKGEIGRRRAFAPKARWKERALRAADTLKSLTLTFNPDGALTAGLEHHPAAAGGSGAASNSLQASHFGQRRSVTCCACLGADTWRMYFPNLLA